MLLHLQYRLKHEMRVAMIKTGKKQATFRKNIYVFWNSKSDIKSKYQVGSMKGSI